MDISLALFHLLDIRYLNDLNPGNITEETEIELEEFIDYAKIVMGTFGNKVFEPFAPSTESAETEPVLYMEIWERQCRTAKEPVMDLLC